MRVFLFVIITFVEFINLASAATDISTGACSNPFVQRDFTTLNTVIYYSSSAAATYRICSTDSANHLTITIVNPNGTQTTLELPGQACMDISTAQLSVKATTATTGSSVFYCKIG
jgi:hypothetical protein